MIRVVLADDHALFRAGVRRLLEDAGDVQVVGEAGRADDFLLCLRRTPADVVVIDVQMPGPGLVAVLRALREGFPAVRVVVLSVFAEEQIALLALRGGALSYLSKDRSPEDLLRAVRLAHEGRGFVSEGLRERMVGGARAAGALGPPHALLSARELEVMRLVGRGLGTTDIARWLGVSPKTVSTFRTRVLRKMGFRTTADIVRYVQEAGLV